MARTKLPNSREATILQILVPGERYGRQIRDEYQRLTGEEMKLGTLYTALERMAGKRFLTARMGAPAPSRRGRRPRFYRISAAGRRALDTYQLREATVFGLIRKAFVMPPLPVGDHNG